MKRILFILIAAAAVLASCNDYETYGDKKEKERNAIAKFISDSSIVVISEDQFNRQGQTTDLARNEYVKFDKNGVYMQIVRQGCGTKIQDGEKTKLVCRFSEFSLLEDTITLCNNNNKMIYYNEAGIPMSQASWPDIMQVSRTGSSYNATFLSGFMCEKYGSAAVPSGWLVPRSYVNVGRPQSADEEYSKVRLIVPHSQGHVTASSNVIPYFYEITFQRES